MNLLTTPISNGFNSTTTIFLPRWDLALNNQHRLICHWIKKPNEDEKWNECFSLFFDIHIYYHFYHALTPQIFLTPSLSLSLFLSLSLSLFIRLYHPSFPAGPPDYILCPHRADVNKFLEVSQHRPVYKRTSFMCSSLLFQPCPACLVCLTWMFFRSDVKCRTDGCLVGCWFLNLLKIAPRIFIHVKSFRYLLDITERNKQNRFRRIIK